MSVYTYHRECIYTRNKTTLLLKFVESIGFPDSEAATAEKLAGRSSLLLVTMVSGKVYEVSTNDQFTEISRPYKITDDEIRTAIYDKWLHINRG